MSALESSARSPRTMGAENCQRVRNEAGLSWLRRALSLLLATLLVCLTQRASAAVMPAPVSANAAVPMCGEHNQSIAAPPIFRVSRDGTLSATPCSSANRFDTGKGTPSPPPRVTIPSAPERAFAVTRLTVVRPAPQRLPNAERTFVLARPGVARDVYRPPCS